MITNNTGKTLFRSLFALATAAGITANIIWQGNVLRALSYYTLQSNVFVLAVILLLLFSKQQNQWTKSFKFMATGGILITFIVYHLVLYPSLSASETFDYPFWFDFPVHTFTPLMMLADFALFDRNIVLRKRNAFAILAFPGFYLVYTVLYVMFGGTYEFNGGEFRYPYFFLNPDLLGYGLVAAFIMGIAAFAVLLGLGLVLLDRKVFFRKAD